MGWSVEYIKGVTGCDGHFGNLILINDSKKKVNETGVTPRNKPENGQNTAQKPAIRLIWSL